VETDKIKTIEVLRRNVPEMDSIAMVSEITQDGGTRNHSELFCCQPKRSYYYEQEHRSLTTAITIK